MKRLPGDRRRFSSALLLGWLAAALACEPAEPPAGAGAPTPPAPGAAAPAPGPRGVVLVLLDTLRADHLGCYGYTARPTTPHLDALAARGVRFDQAVASAPWTLPSVTALLAAQYSERIFDTSDPAPSVMEALQAAGVRTAAFTEGAFVSRHFGMDRGFELWEEEEGPVQHLLPGESRDASARGGVERTFARAEQWLAEQREGPFFLLIHTYEPHAPYTHTEFARALGPPPFEGPFTLDHVAGLNEGTFTLTPALVRYITALYDGDIAATDRRFGRFRTRLEELGLADSVALVVTSDHGEALGGDYPRNRFDHGHSLKDDQVRVPLILHDPRADFGGRVVAAQVRTLDVMPTVAALLEVPLDAQAYDGRSLLPLMQGRESEERLAFLGQTKTGPTRVGVRAIRHKLVFTVPGEVSAPLDPVPPPLQLYALDDDPAESRNRAEEDPQTARTLAELVSRRHPGWDRQGAPVVREDLDPRLRERLESLGYLRTP